MILFDHSESRQRTRLPQNVIDAGHTLVGLEAETGADILLSPLDLPIRELDGSEPSLLILSKHIKAGLLIQRKTGRDAVNSIPDYPSILQRMLEHTAYPWLVTVGMYASNRLGNVVVDGRDTLWSWNAYVGAIEAWQLRGGFYTNLSRDGQMLSWIQCWQERLKSELWKGCSEYKLVERIPKQVIGAPSWVGTVMALGIGFGYDKVKFLEDNFTCLGDFLTFFSDERNLKKLKMKGIGESHFRKVKKLVGYTIVKETT